MKRLAFLVPALFVLGFISCSRAEIETETVTDDTPQGVGETVNVSFAFKGDITIEESPLSKAAGVETESTDLYGISVYYDKEMDGNIDDVYGYGLFDNVADMNISLLTGYRYKFVCSLVKDGKNHVAYNYHYYFNGSYDVSTQGYCRPFVSNSSSYRDDSFDYDARYAYPTPVGNEFILGNYNHLTGLGNGQTNNFKTEAGEDISIYGNDRYYWSDYSSDTCGYKQYPETDRYYGETTGYTPTEGGIVSIELKRCTFGMKLNVSGVTDGSLTVFIDNYSGSSTSYYASYMVFKDITSDYQGVEKIYTFEDIYQCWSDAVLSNVYSKDMYMHILWTRGNNVTQTLETKPVTFKRNVLTTINVNLSGASDENSFNLSLESSEMAEENTDFDYDAGSMEDTTVDTTTEPAEETQPA